MCQRENTDQNSEQVSFAARSNNQKLSDFILDTVLNFPDLQRNP